MKKICSLVLLFLITLAGFAQIYNEQPTTVQGRPYDFSKMPQLTQTTRSAVARSISVGEGFTMDDIEYWVGEGSNRAAFVVQWNDSRETHTMVWGYRWDGVATGIDMIAAIAASDPRFFCLSESGTAYGSTVAGMGYDTDESGTITLIDPNGKSHPVGENGLCAVSGYGYDGWKSGDTEDFWQSGWYEGYWSYWLKEGDGEWSYSGVGASGRVLKDGSWDGWNYMDNFVQSDWKSFAAAPSAGTNYTTGTLFLNEDWFGHNNSTINFLTKKGEWNYRVFQAENEDAELGTTSQYATPFGDNIYILSKQPAIGDVKAGGRLIIANAKTFKAIASFNEIGGGDGRSFVGVTPEKGYIGASNGIYTFDIKNMKIGELIEGTGGGSLYSGQIGLMLQSGKYVFAVSQADGIYVIDVETDKLIKTINGEVSSIAQSADGSIWGAAGTQLIKIDPTTLSTELIQIPTYAKIGSSWGAWNAGSFIADPKENVLYWVAAAKSDWAASNTLYRYEIGNKFSLEYPFFTLPGDKEEKIQKFYGAGVRLDSRSGQLVLTSIDDGWGSSSLKNYMHFVDKTTGDLVRTITPEDHYWFPAMPVIPDASPAVVSGLESSYTFNVNDAAQTIDLSGKITDKDNLNCNIYASVISISDENLLSVTLTDNKLEIKPKTDQSGNASFKLRLISNGRITDKEVMVTVNRDLEGISLSKQSLAMKGGATDTLHVIYTPANTTYQDVTWSYSNYSVATVSNGVVTAKNEGIGYIYVTSANGTYKDTCEITVHKEPLTGIQLLNDTIFMNVGEKDTLNIDFFPADASVKTIKSITAENSSLLTTATYNKTITGKVEGTTRLFVTANEGGFVDTCVVVISFIHAEKMTLSEHELALTAPASKTLTFTYSPANVSNSSVTWSSRDATIASVSTGGSVKALKEGVTTIYAVDKNDPNLMDSCVVTASFISATGVTLNATDTIVSKSKSIYLSATLTPAEASNKKVFWSTSNASVATVSTSGTVKGVAYGTATITATTEDGSFVASCHVTVADIPVTGVAFVSDTLRVKVGKSVFLGKNIIPSNATVTTVSYSSDNTDLATISTSGYVKGITTGNTVVRVSTTDGGFKDSCVVQVIDAVSSVTIQNETTRLIVGDELTVTATTFPESAIDDVTWLSLDKTLGSIDEDGKIVALKSGRCGFVATSTDNTSATDTCWITISNQKSESIALNVTEISVLVNDTLQLNASVLPIKTTNSRVFWRSSDYTLATVSSRGFVKAVNPGKVYIVAMAQDGGAIDSCMISIIQHVTGISLDKDTLELKINEPYVLTATINPSNASDKTIVWISSDPSVVTVNNRGFGQAKSPGSAWIKAVSNDGSFADSCEITVIDPLTTIDPNQAVVWDAYITHQELTVKGLDGYQIQILTLAGTAVLKEKVSGEEVRYPLNLPEGVYLLRGTDGTKIVTRKILIEP
ncbi:MAG: Ig-like domain-containing protein [Bacteroidales bacterium]|nr:Ig-like domain-containing protein [Bacteroidales bacterium]